MINLPLAKKSLGQHWLTDNAALQSICDAGKVTSQDTILEIGPGTGTLTTLLLQKAKQVIAVEFDPKLANDLNKNILHNNSEIPRMHLGKLRVVCQDILSFDLTQLASDYKVVANIPYYLTSNLIRTLSESTNPAATVVLLVQKEVAQRVAAQPGHMSLLSVSAQFYWQVTLGPVITARLFTPPPKVDSQVLILQRRHAPLYPEIEPKHFFRIVKAGYSSRRKTLLNSLSAGLRTDKDQIQQLLLKVQISSNLRAQSLSLDDWYKLSQAIAI